MAKNCEIDRKLLLLVYQRDLLLFFVTSNIYRAYSLLLNNSSEGIRQHISYTAVIAETHELMSISYT